MSRSMSSLLAAILVFAATDSRSAEPAESLLIINAIIIDGSGAAGSPGAVRITDGLISAVGAVRPQQGDRIVDGRGLALAPGFIDTHSHVFEEALQHREALPVVSQGITTSIGGQDGSGPHPLREHFEALEATPAAVNFAAYAGHNTLRELALGKDFARTATAAEIEAMGEMLVDDLKAGALGLGAGLEYEPGIYSDTSEVLALAKITAQHGGRYMSHQRSEDRWFWEALDEAITIGREAGIPVQISHLKLAMTSLWGRAGEVIAKLDAAREEGIEISADIYPYEYWQSNIMVLVPSRRLDAREEFEYALKEVTLPNGLWMTRFDPQPEYVGLKLTEIAALRRTDPVTALMQMARESRELNPSDLDSSDAIIGTSMHQSDIQALLSWPHVNICTDGGIDDLHPRAVGTFPRVLGRYVREDGALRLEEAIRRMTSLAASNVGITDRGLIKPGLAADLVLFDPEAIIDHATPADPKRLSTGVSTVWVNGVAVFRDGSATGRYPGKILRRERQHAF